MIPIYGFLEGDSLGLLIFAYEDETVLSLSKKVQEAAKTRVKNFDNPKLVHNGKCIEPNMCISDTEIKALDRIDIFQKTKAGLT